MTAFEGAGGDGETERATRCEREAFSRQVQRWADEFGVESALEGPVDGIQGAQGVHCVGLARAGVRVVSTVPTEAAARVARAIYACRAPLSAVDVRVVPAMTGIDALPPCDLVVAYDALAGTRDWPGYLARIAKRASKVLVVVTRNAQHWRGPAGRWMGARPDETWRTETLAPTLWELGRVRDHIYFDAPWAPGAPSASLLSGVYTAVVRRIARHHAFVVDVRPRTPQGRRRLIQVHPRPRGPEDVS